MRDYAPNVGIAPAPRNAPRVTVTKDGPTGHAAIIAGLVRKHGWQLGAEIGVHCGETLFCLLREFPDLEMIGVDSWLSFAGNRRPHEIGVPNLRELMQQAEIQVRETAKQFGDHCRLIKSDSVKAADQVEDGSLDFVFIDADHSEQAVIADIRAWRPKVRFGGYLTGHDINLESVRRAVEQTLGSWDVLPSQFWIWRNV